MTINLTSVNRLTPSTQNRSTASLVTLAQHNTIIITRLSTYATYEFTATYTGEQAVLLDGVPSVAMLYINGVRQSMSTLSLNANVMTISTEAEIMVGDYIVIDVIFS